jgi:predicted amidohydrolase
MTHFTIGAVQPPDIQGDVQQALRIITSFMTLADQQGIDVLCFPECFLQGYTFDIKTTKKRAIDLNSVAFKDILAQLKEFRVTIILGLIEKDGSHFFNTAAIIKNGKLVGKYRKVNLFEKNFQPGTEHTVFGVDGLKFGINICYDARFPEGALEMANKGASVIFYPLSNRWPIQTAKKYRYKHIPNLVDRAMESKCWVVSSDITYRDEETMGYGCAAVVSPEGDVVKRIADFEVGMTSFTVN